MPMCPIPSGRQAGISWPGPKSLYVLTLAGVPFRRTALVAACALTLVGVATVLPGGAAAGATAPPVGPTLYFHSANGSYAADAAADPAASAEMRAPAGATV